MDEEKEINGLCPSIRDPLCDDIANISSCNVSFVGDDFNEIFQTVAGHFKDGGDSEYFQDIADAKKGSEDVQDAARDIDDSAAHLNWALSVSMVLSLLLAMLCILILFGVICPEVPKVLQMIRSKVMIPTFTVLVVFAYFFSALSISEVFEDYIQDEKIKNAANKALNFFAIIIPIITIFVIFNLNT